MVVFPTTIWLDKQSCRNTFDGTQPIVRHTLARRRQITTRRNVMSYYIMWTNVSTRTHKVAPSIKTTSLNCALTNTYNNKHTADANYIYSWLIIPSASSKSNKQDAGARLRIYPQSSSPVWCPNSALHVSVTTSRVIKTTPCHATTARASRWPHTSHIRCAVYFRHFRFTRPRARCTPQFSWEIHLWKDLVVYYADLRAVLASFNRLISAWLLAPRTRCEAVSWLQYVLDELISCVCFGDCVLSVAATIQFQTEFGQGINYRQRGVSRSSRPNCWFLIFEAVDTQSRPI